MNQMQELTKQADFFIWVLSFGGVKLDVRKQNSDEI